MTEISVSRDVAAPADAVWQVMTDLERSPQVVSAIGEVERLDDHDGFQVGTRWRETRKMFGREATEEMEVTAVEPGRSYIVAADSSGARYESTMTVEALGEGHSRLSMVFAGEPYGVVSKVFATTVGKLFERPTRKALQTDLDDIARAAEQIA